VGVALESYISPSFSSFSIRSTVLDKWTWEQLRTMIIGGNAAAREFFNKGHGGDVKDSKTKYTSKLATTYKDKLAQKVKEDMLA